MSGGEQDGGRTETRGRRRSKCYDGRGELPLRNSRENRDERAMRKAAVTGRNKTRQRQGESQDQMKTESDGRATSSTRKGRQGRNTETAQEADRRGGARQSPQTALGHCAGLKGARQVKRSVRRGRKTRATRQGPLAAGRVG